MRNIKSCKYCEEIIPVAHNRRLFCRATCRLRHYSARVAGKIDAPMVPDEMRSFCDIVRKHAPYHAVGYALDYPLGRQLVHYPPKGRSLRFDRTFDDSPCFELKPGFELPKVPVAGVYLVRLYDCCGVEIAQPDGLAHGVYVSLVSRMPEPGKSRIARRAARLRW